MKHITLFCEGLHNRAGIERMTVELANMLADDYAVDIVVINPFSYDTCPYEIDSRVTVTSLESTFGKALWNFNIPIVRALRRHLKDSHTDVVITVATPLVRISALSVAGLRIKNIGWEHFNIHAGSKLGCLFKVAASWMADVTVALTESDAREFMRMGGKYVISISNFTSIGVNEPSKCDKKTLLAVGRHEPQKGFDMLIKAWAKADAPGWKLRIVGEGNEKEQNISLAKELGVDNSIEFGNSTPKIAEEFQKASCFVLSSRFEGLVLVLIEAKMMGLPCISFDCPTSPNEIIRDNIDGWLVPPEDIQALASAITANLKDTDKLKAMGAKAREDAMGRYSPEAIKQQWINLIEK